MSFRENARGYLGALPFAILLLALWPIVGGAKALAAATIACVFSLLLEQRWERRFELSFWLAMATFAAVHAFALFLIRFPKPAAGAVAIPFAFVDFFFMLWILDRVDDRFAQGPKPLNRGR